MSDPNPNRCEKCNTRKDISIDLFDTGMCGLCGQMHECVDPNLIDLYRGLGFKDDFIWSKLSRLRGLRHHHSEIQTTLSWFDIGKEITEAIGTQTKK